MSSKFIMIIFLCMNLFASGCGTRSPILATVGNEHITLKEFEEQLQELPPAYQAMFVTREQKEKLLDQMITERLMIQEAIKAGLHRDKKIQQRLKWIKNQMLIEEIIKLKVYEKINVTDEEAKKFYEQHKEELKKLFKKQTFDEMKQDVKQLIRRDDAKTRLIFKGWIEELKKETKITKNLDLLGPDISTKK